MSNMSGRNENDIKNEAKAKELMKGYDLLQEWYYANDEKTTKGRLAYIRYIIDYFKYLVENSNCDVNNVNTFDVIKMTDINKYMNSIKYYTDKDGVTKPLGGSIRNARLAAIRSFFTYLVSVGYINSDPTAKVANPKTKIEKEVVYLEKEDIDKILEDIDTNPSVRYTDGKKKRDKLIINIGCKTGLRETAISEINVEDIDFINKKILVTEKGNVTREIFLGNNTISDIQEYLPYREIMLKGNECNALFISSRKERVQPAHIKKLMRRASEVIGKKVSPHKMRSTCAVNLYDKTGDIYLVKEVLGHKNIANTQRYARVSANRKREAAAILDEL